MKSAADWVEPKADQKAAPMVDQRVGALVALMAVHLAALWVVRWDETRVAATAALLENMTAAQMADMMAWMMVEHLAEHWVGQKVGQRAAVMAVLLAVPTVAL